MKNVRTKFEIVKKYVHRKSERLVDVRINQWYVLIVFEKRSRYTWPR